MTRSIARRLAVLACAATLLVAARASAQPATEPAETYSRVHNLAVLEAEAASELVRRVCESVDGASECRVGGYGRRHVTVTADAATHERIAQAIREVEGTSSSQVFQVILLKAENNGDKGLEKVPAAARAALEDAREFLPYNGYEVLGTALLRTDENAESIINGPEGQDYQVGISYYRSVTLKDERLVLRRFSLERLVTVNQPANVPRIETLGVLSTSFGMQPGETVIVGTSKLEGSQRALVVLLTNVD